MFCFAADAWRVRDEWYFFTTKPNTDSVIPTNDGYYSVITEDQIIKQEDEDVGYMTTMAYFQGRPPKGKKSKWTIYEFRVKPDTIPATKHDDALKAKVMDSPSLEFNSIFFFFKFQWRNLLEKEKRIYLEDLGLILLLFVFQVSSFVAVNLFVKVKNRKGSTQGKTRMTEQSQK